MSGTLLKYGPVFGPPGTFDIVWNTRVLQRVGRQIQDVQLSQRDRAAGCVIVFAKSRRLELGDNILHTL